MILDHLHLAKGPEMVSDELPGTKAKKLLKQQDLIESNNRSYPRSIPLVPKIAKGTIIEDVDGNRYMDFFSMCGVLNIGHCNEIVLKSVQKQMHIFTHGMDFPTEVKMNFMKNLNARLPKGLKDEIKINFCGPSGADAVEAAIKLSRIHSGRNLIISFQGAYHGMTVGALSVTSNNKNREKVSVLNNATHFAPYSYCYRCPFNKKPSSCKIECASHIKNLLDNPNSGVDKPAAVIIEPIQGEGGVVVPKAEFHKELRKICDERDIILIHDEVQVGFYRTGKLLCSEHFDISPDIVAMSKGIGGIGIPLALILIKKEFDTWKAGTHAGTFRGHQLGMVAGNTAMKFIDSIGLIKHVQEMGKLLKEGLLSIKKESKFIGDVRGLGLIIGVEYVRDLKTKEPFPEFCNTLKQRLFENGILIEIGGHFSNVVRILPPLVTTERMFLSFLDIFASVNHQVENQYY